MVHHLRFGNNMEHSFNKWVFSIHNPNYDKLEWDRPVIRMKQVGSNGFFAGYDIKKGVLQISFRKYIYTWSFIPQEIYQGLLDAAKVGENALMDFFHGQIKARYTTYMTQRASSVT